MAFLKRVRDYAAMDHILMPPFGMARPAPVVKKKKETVVVPIAQQPAAATPPPTQKDGDDPRASVPGLSSRDSEAQPQEKVVSIIKLTPEAPALSSPAEERCRVAEAELETLPNERAVKARQHEAREEKLKAREDAVAGRDTELKQSAREQAIERGRMEKLKEELEAEKARLEAKAEVLAKDRATFDSLEDRSRKALEELYGRGLKEPLVTATS
nr:protein pxr1-like [Aegilops tauschii subsp. strangulata]